MVAENLKKLVFRKELALIKELICSINPSITVQSVEGQSLIGEVKVDNLGDRHLIQLDKQILGWVRSS